MKYKHIIWDWNGTLLNDLELAVATIGKLMNKHGLQPISKEGYLKEFGFPVEEYYKRIGFDFEKVSNEDLSNDFVSTYKRHWDETDLHNEVVETLKEITAMGMTQSILSASEQVILYEILEKFGLSHHFIAAVGLDNHEAKSKVERGLEWLNNTNLDGGATIMVGDTLHDYEVAKELGCDCILISHGHQSYERLQKAGVPVARNYRDVLDYIR